MPKAPENIFPMIAQLAAEQFGTEADKVTAETSLADDLGADSLDRVDFVMKLERVIGVDVPQDAIERVQTLGDVERELRKLCE